MDRERLLDDLLLYLETGSFDPALLLPVIRTLRPQPQETPSRWELLRALDSYEGPEFERLRRGLTRAILNGITEARESVRRGGDVPPEVVRDMSDLPADPGQGWHTGEACAATVTEIVSAYQDLQFLATLPRPPPRIQKRLKAWLEEQREAVRYSMPPWTLLAPSELLARIPTHKTTASVRAWLDDRKALELDAVLRGTEITQVADEQRLLKALLDRFRASQDAQEKSRILDRVLAWPTALAAAVIPQLCTERWAQDRAALILQLRGGLGAGRLPETWPKWLRRLSDARSELDAQRVRVAKLSAGHERTLLRHWYACQTDPDPKLQRALYEWSQDTLAPSSAEAFLRRHGDSLDRDEVRSLESAAGLAVLSEEKKETETATEGRVAPSPEIVVGTTETEESIALPATSAPVPTPPPAPPSFWTRHVQSFFAENWFMVAGILMVVVGASILAYFTWDKHWLIRYTIMPTLLGGFTFALAGMGRFLEKRETELRNAAAMLRGAAILLLPINFMAVTFLWDDPSVPAFVVPVMAAVYLLVFGWGLRSWCTAVHPALNWLAGGTLLFLNFLVFLGPLGRSLLSVADQPMLTVLSVGFYVGFLIMAAAVVAFSERALTAELAREKRVPWFFGLTLGVTYLQVFAWVHGLAGLVPQVATYAPAIVLAGGLVLYLEGKGLELRGKQQIHEVESFLGFALVLLGVLMAAGHDLARILAFLFAGAVWLQQGARRNADVHRWIGMTLLFFGGASVGLHSAFPTAWLPAIGLLSAAAFLGASAWLLRRQPDNRTAQIAREMVAPILLLTALVAIVTQWTEGSEPLWTAGVLLLIATWFTVRSLIEKRVRWLCTAMVLLAALLPYVGCVDLSQRSWHGNTMVFGLAVLSLLWIAANALYRTPLMRSARSTVLWTYGALAMVGMVVRVVLEPVTPADAESMRVLMNYSGPLLMALALGFTTYTSRSIVPAFMAMTIVVILFPELQARFDEELQALGWGTGIGSAVNALWMTLACFGLRAWKRLEHLGAGDRIVGRYAFPLVRTDYKLFTWPLMVSALFLLVRTNTITYVRNLPDVPGLTALALCLAGVAWTAQAIYHHRSRPGAVAGTHLGWISLLLGLGHWMTWPENWDAAQGYFFRLGVALLALYVIYRLPPFSRRDWARALLSAPLRRVLAGGTILFSLLWTPLLYVKGMILGHVPLTPSFVLLLAALNVWEGIRTQWRIFGDLLFVLCGAYVMTGLVRPVSGEAWYAMSDPLLWYLLGVQALLIVTSFFARLDEPLRALRASVSSLSAGLLLMMGLLVAGLELLGIDPPAHEFWMLFAGLVLAAWSTGNSAWVLVALLAAFASVRGSWFSPGGADGLAVLGATLIGLSLCGRYLTQVAPQWLHSRLPWRVGLFERPIAWLPLPAATIAFIAAVLYALIPELRGTFTETWIPYLCAATLAAVAFRTRIHELHALALAVISTGNVFAVRALLGEQLAAWGLSDVHTICIGLIVTLAELTGLRQALRSFRLRTYIGRTCLVLAGLVLLLLSGNYMAHPSLAEIQWQRFAISGLIAILAGLYFRQVARSKDAWIRPYVRLCEGMYHYALALAIGCFALLVPFLRTPATAMFALGMPALYFYARAELLFKSNRELAERYRGSARVLCFILLGLYILRPTFQLAFFPGEPLRLMAYHWNAPLVMLLGFVMIRLRGLGASPWLSYFGGLAIMIGSYFLLTWLPGLSPFYDPVPAAWCAVVLSHFWMAVSSNRSPLRTAMQRLGALSDEEWHEGRTSWGTFLLLALHVAGLWGLAGCEPGMPLAFAPLLAGIATVSLHRAILRRSLLLYALAGFELLLALHTDFFIESFISARAIVWILLGLWAAALAVQASVGRHLDVRRLQAAASALFVLCFGHALYHTLWSAAGLWVVGLASGLALLTPQEREKPEQPGERWIAASFLFLPVWLTYFGLLRGEGLPGAALEPWPLGMSTLVLLGLAAGLRWCATNLPPTVALLTPGLPRLIDQTRSVVISAGRGVGLRLVWVALAITVLLQLLSSARPLEVREHWIFLALYAAIGWEGWTVLSRPRPGVATLLVELSGIGFLVALRSFVVTTNPGLWRYEYDVWAALLLSMLLTGSKQFLDRGPAQVRRALLPGMFLLPAFSILWALGHGLGTNVLLLIVGLHSLMFSYMGKDERESPYRVVSIIGFVAFVLIAFHSKFEFRDVHAYVIPVGLGVLALVQVLRNQMTAGTRDRIRLATHLAMLVSAGYYALIDDRHTIAFNVTLFLLCLASMAAGALLRVRLFLVLGFGGLVVSLGSIFYHVLRAMDHTARLTLVGLLVLLVGVGFVMGTVWYKTHRDRMNAVLAKWQRKLGDWE